MKIGLIVNPKAGTAAQFLELRQLLEEYAIPWWTTEATGHATVLAVRLAREDFDAVVAVGGDGTVHEVANGLRGAAARLGVLPLGTGNDLARTLAMPWDVHDALVAVQQRRTRPLDMIRVEPPGRTLHAVNAAAGGFSGRVSAATTTALKAAWGPLAYLLGAARVLPEMRDYETVIAYDDEPARTLRALNVVVANGRTVAGGRVVAPRANPEDGLLDVAVVRACSALEMAEVAAMLMAGRFLESAHVMHRRARRVHVAAEPGMLFNVDGELLTDEPITFSAEPAALRVIVGEDYEAEPSAPPEKRSWRM